MEPGENFSQRHKVVMTCFIYLVYNSYLENVEPHVQPTLKITMFSHYVHRGWFLHHPTGDRHCKELQTSQHSSLLWQLHTVNRLSHTTLSGQGPTVHSSVCSPVCRAHKLWICMEFCGGGSLQDIYQGEKVRSVGVFAFQSTDPINDTLR